MSFTAQRKAVALPPHASFRAFTHPTMPRDPDHFRAMTLNRQPNPGRRRALLSLLSLATLAACGGGGGGGGGDDAAPATPTDAALDQAAQSAVNAGLVGLALGTVDDAGHGTRVGAAGRRRLGAAQALAVDDRFNIGSNTKAMTAMVIASHVARGALAWSTRISDALPAETASMLPAYAGVTLQQLLDHRGGLPGFTGDGEDEVNFVQHVAQDAGPLPTTLPARRRYFTRYLVRQQPPAGVVPGQDFNYSNAGYAVAAAMLEAATGRDFETLFREAIVDGLGLDGAFRLPIDVADTQPPTQPLPHEGPQGGVAVHQPGPLERQFGEWERMVNPAGLWSCSLPTYMRWLKLHQEALRGQATALPAGYVARLAALAPNDYALGWQALVLAPGTPTLLAHNGYVAGFMALAAMDQAGHWAGAAFTNTAYEADDGSSWVQQLLTTTLLSAAGA